MIHVHAFGYLCSELLQQSKKLLKQNFSMH